MSAGLLYGPDEGYLPLREELAKWLSEFYRPEKAVTVDRVVTTEGASQTLGTIMETLTDPGYTRNVWMISPAYYLAFRIFQDAGFDKRLRSVPEDEKGVDIDFLRREMQKVDRKHEQDQSGERIYKFPRDDRKIYRHVVYAVPSFSNPSSKTMTLERRQELVRCARDYDALVICDDVYDFLQWPADPSSSTSSLTTSILPRLVDIDRTLDSGAESEGSDGFGNVVSNGSFSKIAAPGIRVGWVEGTPKLAFAVSQGGTTKSGGAPSHMTSAMACDLMETGILRDHVFKVLQPGYASRYRKMRAAIEHHLVPLGVRLPQTDRDTVGGYFLWFSLPGPLKAAEVAERAQLDANLIVARGGLFEVPGDAAEISFPDCLRVCFAWEDEEKLAEGIHRLAGVIRSMQLDQN